MSSDDDASEIFVVAKLPSTTIEQPPTTVETSAATTVVEESSASSAPVIRPCTEPGLLGDGPFRLVHEPAGKQRRCVHRVHACYRRPRHRVTDGYFYSWPQDHPNFDALPIVLNAVPKASYLEFVADLVQADTGIRPQFVETPVGWSISKTEGLQYFLNDFVLGGADRAFRSRFAHTTLWTVHQTI